MVEMLKEERKIYKKDGKWRMYLSQVQEYPEDAVQNFVASFDVDEEEKKAWLSKFDEHKALAIKEAVDTLEKLKAGMEKDIGFIGEGKEIWQNPTELSDDEEWPTL